MLIDACRLAVEALSRNTLQSLLTALGVLIGVGAVIAMLSIGHGASRNVRDEIAKLGAEFLALGIGQQKRGGQGASIDAPAFSYADVEAIRSQVRGLRHVAPLAIQFERTAARNANWQTKVIGTENAYFHARGWPLSAGRWFTESETYNGKPLCLIGATVHEKIFAGSHPIGEPLRVGNMPCTVIGTLAHRGQSGSSEDDDNVVAVPFDAFQRRIQGSSDITSIVLAAYPGSNIDRLKVNIIGLMRERRGLPAHEPDDFTLLDMRQVAQSMAAATGTFTLFLGAIAAVSLVVGGIGIMNIMLVSVTERTREIGVRLAIGATPSQIRQQFLCEAVILTVAGGLGGIAAGLGVAVFAAPMLGIPFVLDPSTILLALGVSSVLGIAFGYAPASKAAALDPVEALRHA